MRYFRYTPEQTGLLSRRDRKLGNFIARRGYVEREVFDDFFTGLCYNIVGQQLSMKACETLWGKLVSAVGSVTPHNCSDPAVLKGAGLSQAKADCIAECSARSLSGELSERSLRKMTDEEVTAALTEVKGIGRWTAEMVLIFCLERPDVLSLSDFGIRKGLCLLHGTDPKDKAALAAFKELYSPYGTAASLYLWEAARLINEKGEILC